MYAVKTALAGALALVLAGTAGAQESGERNDPVTGRSESGEQLKAMGTVIRAGTDRLVVRTSVGERTFIVSDDVQLPRDLAQNQNVTVWYREDPSDPNRLMVQRVEMSSGSGSSQAGSSADPTGRSAEQSRSRTAGASGQERASETGSSTSRSRLPQTASAMPFVTLIGLGLVSLGGIALLRKRN